MSELSSPPPPSPDRPPLPADAKSAIRRARWEREAKDGLILKRVLWTFALMMGTNVITHWVISNAAKQESAEALRTGDNALAVATVVDAIFIGAFWLISRREFAPGQSPAVSSWRDTVRYTLLATFALLAINFAYHGAIRTLFGLTDLSRDMGSSYGFGFSLLFICICPALLEEFFFRKICYDFFVPQTGATLAAFASGVMFACAHTLAVISFPYLALFGFVAAQLRRRTGGLLAPMIMHFTHNLVVILHERFF